jgi:hypothetical protein
VFHKKGNFLLYLNVVLEGSYFFLLLIVEISGFLWEETIAQNTEMASGLRLGKIQSKLHRQEGRKK